VEPAGLAAPSDGEQPSSCDVSDACDALHVGAARSGRLRPCWPGCRPLAGPLITIRLEPADAPPSPLPQLLDVLQRAQGGLVLVDLGGRTDVQCWGAVLATAARRYGVQGALVNGSVRDVDALCEMDFPTYGRGVYPAAMRGRLRLVAIGEPVDLDGTWIDPNGFAVVDSSGAVFVPKARIGEVLLLAAQRRRSEWERVQEVMAGADPRHVFLAESDAVAGWGT